MDNTTTKKPGTPLPWTHKKKGPNNEVLGADGNIVCDDEMYYPQAVSEPDAAYIVHAANAYPKLVTALRELRALRGAAKVIADALLRELDELE